VDKTTKQSPRKPQALLARITNAFPELQWGAYIYLDQGWDHEVLILDNRLVFRFPNDEHYLKLLRNEADVLERLKPLVTAAIPEYRYFAPDGSFAGYPIVQGKPVLKSVFEKFKPDDREALAEQLARLLSSMHTFVQNGHSENLTFSSYMDDDQGQTKRQADEYLKTVLGTDDFALTQAILAEVDALLELPLPAVLLHGDIYHDHLLWDQDAKQLGVIDFSDMALGDPAFDFAELYEYGEDFVRQIYGLYTGPKDETFLERAWAYQRWVGVYMMTDHFVHHKTSFEEARQTFDWVKLRRP